MNINKKVENTMAKVFGVFVFIFMAVALITAISHVGPYLSHDSTEVESFDLIHDADTLTDSSDYEGWEQVSSDYDDDVVVLEDGADYGNWVKEWNTSEYDFESDEVTFRIELNDWIEENVTDLNLVFASPETDEDYVYTFNHSDIQDEDHPPYIEETVSMDELPNVSGTEGFETHLEAQRDNSNGTSEGELEVFEASISWETESSSGSDYVGKSLLSTIGGMVLVFGGLVGLVVVLAQTLTD